MTTTLTIPGQLDRVAENPGGITFYDAALSERHLPYAELARRARAFAGALQARGVRAGDRVALLGSTSPELVVALFGTWYSGAAPVILPHPRPRTDQNAYATDVSQRIAHIRARLLLVGDSFASVPLADVGAPAVTLTELAHSPHDAVSDVAVDPDSLAFLQFTSGSTGRSRAVTLTHRQMLANVAAIGAALGIDESRRWVSWLPLYHDMGLISLVTMVTHGLSAFLQPTEDFARAPRSWMAAVSKYRANITVGPNFAWGLAARSLGAMQPGALDLTQLRIAGNGAEPINAADLQVFADAAARHGMQPGAVCPMYGLAEATLAVSLSRTGAPVREVSVAPDQLHQDGVVQHVAADAPYQRRIVGCGPVITGMDVAIRSTAGEVHGEGIVGEICLSGPSVMRGYWEDEDATAAVIQDGWLHTGDLGFFDGGQLFICGRLKDMIIVGGRNLYPEDYEHLTATVPGVRRGNAIAFGLTELERMVVIAETPRSGDNAQTIADNVMRELRNRLPHAPHEVVLVTSGTLPKTSSGKVQRRLCRDWYRAGQLPVVATASAV
jgi:fatty-acyl-CoA synthase